MSNTQSLAYFAIIAGGTMLVRFLPFLIFPENREAPSYIQYLGRVLPYTIIGMLVVYCLKGIQLFSFPFGIPEAVGVGAVSIIQLWRKNMLLSIGGGTLIYMVFVQMLF